MTLPVLAKTTEIAWSLLESYDIDPLPFFQQAGIDPETMNDIHGRISHAASDTLWRSIANRLEDRCFAVRLGRLWHPSYIHVLGYAWLTSSTLGSALNRLVRYSSIINRFAQITVDEIDDGLSVQWRNTAIPEHEYWRAEAALVVIMAMCRANYGNGLDPVRVTFKHHKPACAGDFFEYFRCPIDFNARHDSLVLTLECTEKRLSGSNPLLAQINDQLMIKYLAQLDEDNIIQRVKATIIDQLPDGKMSDAKVAKALGMGNRTLQRRLHDEGTTFKKVLKDVRKSLAMKYILDSQLTLTELSFQLGFSEMSSFSRAFKNWTGQSPSDFRETLKTPSLQA